MYKKRGQRLEEMKKRLFFFNYMWVYINCMYKQPKKKKRKGKEEKSKKE